MQNDDRALMRRIQHGDQLALAELYRRYADPIYSLALHILRDKGHAEEVTQDIFLRVWNQSACWDPQRGKLVTWMLAMTRNLAIDRIRAENRRPQFIDTPVDNILNLIASDDGDWQRGQMLRVMMSQLPQEQAQVIQLAFFGGMTHEDMSQTLGVPLGTIKTRIRAGLKKLRKLWLEEERDEQQRLR